MQKEDISLLRIYAKNDMNCVKTATAGGPVVENFRLCEVVM